MAPPAPATPSALRKKGEAKPSGPGCSAPDARWARSAAEPRGYGEEESEYDVAEGRAPPVPAASGVAFAEGTNQRAHSTAPAAVAVMRDRR